MKYGLCREIRVETSGKNLAVSLLVEHETHGWIWAVLPDREKAAILPRSIFCPPRSKMTREGLSALRETAEKLLRGRMIRIWRYREVWYCGFPSWRGIGVEEEGAQEPSVKEETTEEVQE